MDSDHMTKLNDHLPEEKQLHMPALFPSSQLGLVIAYKLFDSSIVDNVSAHYHHGLNTICRL